LLFAALHKLNTTPSTAESKRFRREANVLSKNVPPPTPKKRKKEKQNSAPVTEVENLIKQFFNSWIARVYWI